MKTLTDPVACFTALKLQAAPAAFLENWSESADLPLIYEAAYIQEQCEFLGFSADLTQACQELAQQLSKDPVHSRLLQHMVYTFQKRLKNMYVYPVDLTNAELLPPLINVILCIQLVDNVRQRYRSLGISEEICRDTLSDVAIWVDDYKAKTNGRLGFAQMGWLSKHFQLGIFKLGRLQFDPGILYDPIQVYRHRKNGEIIITCKADQRICEDGLFESANSCGVLRHVTEFKQDATSITATVFDLKTGLALPEPRRFLSAEYDLVLDHGDAKLGVHIAALGPMQVDDCWASFAQAMPFFAKHFPDLKPKAFFCSSWLLNANFTKYLKPSANIVQFLGMWNLFARPKTDDHEFFMRVWRTDKIDINTAAQDSSLQRAVIAHLKAGGRWNDMGGVIFADQIPSA